MLFKAIAEWEDRQVDKATEDFENGHKVKAFARASASGIPEGAILGLAGAGIELFVLCIWTMVSNRK